MTRLSQACATGVYVLQLTPCSDIYATALRCIKHCCNAVVKQLPEFLPDKLLCQMPGQGISGLNVLLAGFLCNRSRSVARAVSGLSACLSRRLLHVDLISPACTSGIWAFRGMWYWQHMQCNAAGFVKSQLEPFVPHVVQPRQPVLNLSVPASIWKPPIDSSGATWQGWHAHTDTAKSQVAFYCCSEVP